MELAKFKKGITALAVAAALVMVPAGAWAAEGTDANLAAGTVGLDVAKAKSTAKSKKAKKETPAKVAYTKRTAKLSVDNMHGNVIADSVYYIARGSDTRNVVAGLGSRIRVQAKSGKKMQMWDFDFDYDTQCYTIKNLSTKKVLTSGKKSGDVVYASTLVKKSQRLSRYATRNVPIPTQRWLLRSSVNGYVFVSAVNNDLAINISGKQLRVVHMNKAKSKRFWLIGARGTFVKNGIGNGYYALTSKYNNKIMAIKYASVNPKAKVVTNDRTSTWGQIFEFRRVKGDYYRILSFNSGMALTAAGKNVIQRPVATNKKVYIQKQLWKAKVVGSDGSVQFTNGNYALTAKGHYVVLKKADKAGYVSKAQKWKMSPSTTGLTNYGKKALYKANMYRSKTKNMIVVDMTAHELFCFEKAGKYNKAPWQLDCTCRCATGSDKSTAACTAVLSDRAVRKEFIGAKYCINVHRGSHLHSGIFGPPESEQMGWNISHGCIRVPMKFAEYFYYNVKDGTKIVRYY